MFGPDRPHDVVDNDGLPLPPREPREEWTVHVSGPDDVLPAKDYADAVKLANQINDYYADRIADFAKSDIDPKHFPHAWATPCLRGRYAYPLTPEEMR